MRPTTSLLVTGGAGFIGSAFIRYLLKLPEFTGRILNYDLLTYAANLDFLKGFENHPRYRFVQGDIRNQALVEKLLLDCEIDMVVHFAAETHVDRSIASASPFIETNVLGTLSLLEAVKKFPHVHFHHISTDEVYGSLGESGSFSEISAYRPNSPYSASKAASDHLVRAFAQTYRLSTTMSHCSNNYGPCQNREKFIPLMIHNCLKKKPLPVYGRGSNIRDWIYVDDHAEAVWRILQKGRRDEVYDIGGNTELSNLELLQLLIDLMQKERPGDYHSLIRFVQDRPGHDYRYAINSFKIENELDWRPKINLNEGLLRTIRWYAS
ncbi:MAG: dTDP-glucose 4,6-dehydratase [Chlamydiae bacterium CG10_big_fil_rev_8_21_14_0_10_42_34]|nr:MAG: dTDP-glucose 4,6-dehydratase [Chlamydiae bacterium CG10_big_fil_rev_8_21_14_0_10_42_34]